MVRILGPAAPCLGQDVPLVQRDQTMDATALVPLRFPRLEVQRRGRPQLGGQGLEQSCQALKSEVFWVALSTAQTRLC
jgi:hypothetical protein